jgi:hypothetical protein
MELWRQDPKLSIRRVLLLPYPRLGLHACQYLLLRKKFCNDMRPMLLLIRFIVQLMSMQRVEINYRKEPKPGLKREDIQRAVRIVVVIIWLCQVANL